MATPVGRADSSVADILLTKPWDFDFFQAVRLIGLMHPGRRPISGFRQPSAELVRFHAHLSMAFPASAIQEITKGTEADDPLHLMVNFLGLTGPTGALPTYYTEYLIGRSQARDGAAAAFFDLFNHRLVSLFYLAWEKHHFPVVYQRDHESLESRRHFTGYLFDLIGMGTAGLEDRLEFADSTLLSYCGLFAQRPHSATNLAGMLRDYFRVPVEIDQFVGRWCYLDAEDLSCLNSFGPPSQLGAGAVAGTKLWNPQARFRVRIGPLDWDRFNSFLPGGSAFGQLVALVRYFANQAMDFEVQLILVKDQVREWRLSDGRQSPRLGLSLWLKTAEFQEHAADLLVSVRASEAA